jgi:hypothetical protein
MKLGLYQPVARFCYSTDVIYTLALMLTMARFALWITIQ